MKYTRIVFLTLIVSHYFFLFIKLLSEFHNVWKPFNAPWLLRNLIFFFHFWLILKYLRLLEGPVKVVVSFNVLRAILQYFSNLCWHPDDIYGTIVLRFIFKYTRIMYLFECWTRHRGEFVGSDKVNKTNAWPAFLILTIHFSNNSCNKQLRL